MEIREILPWDKPHFCRMVHDFYHLPAVAHSIPDSYAERTFDLLMGTAVAPRRQFIEEHADEVLNPDI